MRHCLYHTALGQNAVFQNFAIQIALVKYSGRWKHAWAFSKTVTNVSKITYTDCSSHFHKRQMNDQLLSYAFT